MYYLTGKCITDLKLHSEDGDFFNEYQGTTFYEDNQTQVT